MNWCFRCQQEGHWPAECRQATRYLKQLSPKHITRDLSSAHKNQNYVPPEITCSKCVTLTSDVNNNDITIDMIDSLTCQCQYLKSCQSKDVNVSVNYTNLKQDCFLTDLDRSIEENRQKLLPLLYFRQAIDHRMKKQRWNWSSAEIKTNAFLQKISRPARLRVKSTFSDTFPIINNRLPQPPPPSLMNLRRGRTVTQLQSLMRPKYESERFLLITVQQFIKQCHILLEFVYVSLMGLDNEQLELLSTSALKLEAILFRINEIFASETIFGINILEDLHKLHETGLQTIRAMTSLLQRANHLPSYIHREGSFLNNGFVKLPPIGQQKTF